MDVLDDNDDVCVCTLLQMTHDIAQFGHSPLHELAKYSYPELSDVQAKTSLVQYY